LGIEARALSFLARWEFAIDAHNLESRGAPDTRWGRLFRHADFIKLWTGKTVSLFGTPIGNVALSFAAVISLCATPFQMGFLAAAGNVPTLVFSLVMGAWVDRLRRRPIMIFADLGRTAILATIPLAAVYAALGMRQLYVVMLLAAVAGSFLRCRLSRLSADLLWHAETCLMRIVS
jgi:MFS family permease